MEKSISHKLNRFHINKRVKRLRLLNYPCLSRACLAADWFVSYDGWNNEVCGNSKEKPCLSLGWTLDRVQSEDTIIIDGTFNASYILCNYHLAKSITLVGYNGLPIIHCPVANRTHRLEHFELILKITSNYENNLNSFVYAYFRRIHFKDGDFVVSDCSIEITESIFTNIQITTYRDCEEVTFTLSDSLMQGMLSCNDVDCEDSRITHKFICESVDVVVQNSQLQQTVLDVIGFNDTHIIIQNTIFSNNPSYTRGFGGLNVEFDRNNTSVDIKNCTFEDLINPTRTKSLINLFGAAVRFKSLQKTFSQSQLKREVVRVNDCKFINNERALTVVGAFHISVNDSLFFKNMAVHAGAAVLVLSKTSLTLNNCTFINNTAGAFRDDYQVIEPIGQFLIENEEIIVSTERCQGTASMVGKGGALRIDKGEVQLNSCHFENNTATLLGGSVFIDIEGSLKVNDTYFKGTVTNKHSSQGDILFSDGRVVIYNVQFVVPTALNGISVVRHSGNHWSLNISNVWIQCPIGYELRITNSSAYYVLDVGLQRGAALDQLSYFCESCPRHKYSLGFGYLNNSLQYDSTIYVALYVNGSKPISASRGQYIHQKIYCSKCPYGGHCLENIGAVANFWGYIEDGSIRFQHCPSEYCCTKPQCPTIDECAPFRHGTLCGRCQLGYSEALFSPTCVPNNHCGTLWLYPFFFSVGLIYFIFLIFQIDLKRFLFITPIKCFDFLYHLRSSCNKALKCRKKFKKCKPNGRHVDGTSSESQFIANQSDADSYAETQQGSKTIPVPPINNCHERSQGKQRDFHDAGSGLLIILFYYFQDCILLHVKTVYIVAESKSMRMLRNVILSLFRFQLDFFDLIEEVCIMPDITPVPKALLKALTVPYVLALFAVAYILGKALLVVATPKRRDRVMSRLSTGFTLALLFGFQKLGTTSFTLLNCVYIQGVYVLHVDGTVACYTQTWQYAVLLYAAACVAPFCFVLMLGPTLLQKGVISLIQFFAACFCPLPFLLSWIMRRLWQQAKGGIAISANTKAVLKVLQGPFSDDKQNSCISMSGILIGRRLVLILFFTFINNSLVRLLCMFLACLAILLHQVHDSPYRDRRANAVATASASALIVVASVNLVRAGFEAAEYIPTGPNEMLMKVFNEFENVLMLWLPIVVISFFVLVFLLRVLDCLYLKITSSGRTNENSSEVAGSHILMDETCHSQNARIEINEA